MASNRYESDANTGEREQDPPTNRFSAIRPRPSDLTIPNFGDKDLQTVAFQPQQLGLREDQIHGDELPPLFIPGYTEVFWDGKPVRKYKILTKVYNMIQAENEEVVSMTRQTYSGRKIRYELSVLQHPERARACGAGPRSSADRRPVDPPPVVQLNIFDDDDGGNDITMTYDSGFMLYASLENSRPIANGRLHPGSVPVLTGVAVASPAYLDKPTRAGYFIFPDLSVRHEGYYRLRFSLFEGVKHPENADPENPIPVHQEESKGASEVKKHQAMANRMEVQSRPFQVFSAKKFPGLAQSTDLSKLVADQGCRVRIRREIRQRKRPMDGKPAGDGSYQVSPDATPYSEIRSASRNSLNTRRMSGESYHRPTPSRTMSIASMSQTSPLTPTAHQMPMAPPPLRSERPDWPVPSPSPYGAARMPFDPIRQHDSIRQQEPPSRVDRQPEPYSRVELPPIQAPGFNTPKHLAGFNTVTKQYDFPSQMSTKRPHSLSNYDDERAMKDGLRPNDQLPAPVTCDRHTTIEAEDGPEGDDSLEAQYYTYKRADGSAGFKQNPALFTKSE